MDSYLNRRVKYTLVTTFVAIFCLLMTTDVRAETQVVDINKSFSENEVFIPSAKEIRNEALVQGAIQAINKILHTRITNPEKVLFQGYLKNKIDKYVLSYSTEKQLITDKQCSLTMNVTLNIQALKELLKEWGTYYTYQKNYGWRYTIQGKLNSEQKREIHMLESISGLTRKGSGYPSLELRRMEGNNNWLGILKTENTEWTEQNPELYVVWKRLWSEYFSDPRVMDKIEEKLYICIGYWASVTGMQSFHHNLDDWEYLLDSSNLMNASIKANGIKGCWKLVTVNVKPLKGKLMDYIESRNLQYSVYTSEKDITESGF